MFLKTVERGVIYRLLLCVIGKHTLWRPLFAQERSKLRIKISEFEKYMFPAFENTSEMHKHQGANFLYTSVVLGLEKSLLKVYIM